MLPDGIVVKTEMLGELAVIEQSPRMDGRQLVMLLAPGKKKSAPAA